MVQGRRRRVDELSAALAARVGAPDRAVSDEGPNSRWMTCVLRGVALASGSLSLYSRDPSRHAPRIRPESTVAARLRRRLDRWPRDTRVFAPASYVGDSQVNSPFATFIGARSLRRALVPGDGSDLRYRGIRAGATARKPRGRTMWACSWSSSRSGSRSGWLPESVRYGLPGESARDGGRKPHVPAVLWSVGAWKKVCAAMRRWLTCGVSRG